MQINSAYGVLPLNLQGNYEKKVVNFGASKKRGIQKSSYNEDRYFFHETQRKIENLKNKRQPEGQMSNLTESLPKPTNIPEAITKIEKPDFSTKLKSFFRHVVKK